MSIDRYVLILPDIEVKNLDGAPFYPAPVTHRAFLRARATDASFGNRGLPGILLAAETLACIGDAAPGDVVRLPEECYSALLDATRAPTGGYDTIAALALIPFMRSVLDAPTTKPKGPTKNA